MNIHIITQNEPFYIPKMIKYIFKNKTSDINITSYTIMKPHRKNKSMKHWIYERIIVYNLYELFLVFAAFSLIKLLKLFIRDSSYNSQKVLQKEQAINVETEDINSTEYLNKLKEFNIDIIISISCPQLFGEELLKLPNMACINAHGTLLPRHRGVFGSWWTLFKNDDYAGGTIHTMELKLDAGKILWQESFLVTKKDTQYSIAYKTKAMMAKGILKTIENYKNNRVSSISSSYKNSYHRAPTKLQGMEFHEKGKKIIIFSDLLNIIKKDYKNA